jgi:hypothetical protein
MRRPGLLGMLDDLWQVRISDVGCVRVDKRGGGKFVVLSPGYKFHRSVRRRATDDTIAAATNFQYLAIMRFLLVVEQSQTSFTSSTSSLLPVSVN